jgi:hypothetical protein
MINPLALASGRCARCHSFGMLARDTVCGCVYQRVVRAVMNKYNYAAIQLQAPHPLPLHGIKGPRGIRHGFNYADFRADVYLTARRMLTDPVDWAVFRAHYLEDGTTPCISKATFAARVRRINSKLGRAFTESQPYAIYPCDEYLGGSTRNAGTRPLAGTPEPRFIPLRPPLAPRQPLKRAA